MRLTAPEEYALRCLRFIARRGAGATVAAATVAAGEAITLAHATAILRRLRQAGFLQSVRGQAGGYRLAAAPGAIRLDAVIAALGERIAGGCDTGRFRGQDDWCRHAGHCDLNVLWRGLDRLVAGFLAEWTVADLLRPSVEFEECVDQRLAVGITARRATPESA